MLKKQMKNKMEKKEFKIQLEALVEQKKSIQSKIDELVNEYATSVKGFRVGQKLLIKNYSVYPNRQRYAYLKGWKYNRLGDSLEPILQGANIDGTIAPWMDGLRQNEVMELPTNR